MDKLLKTMAKKKIITEVGITGSGKGLVNTNSADFLFLKEQILRESKKQNKRQVAINHLLSLKYQMEDYFQNKNPSQIISIGTFLRKFIDVIGLKHNFFAEYIGIDETNFSALLRGRRKINLDIAIKLGKIFNVSPTLWLSIQNKNELLTINENRNSSYDKYNLDDLLKKAG